jgi:DDE superfamily endonuclease
MSSVLRRRSRRPSMKQLRVLHRHQVRSARKARRDLDRIHQHLPRQAQACFGLLAQAFTRPTYRRFVVLAVAAILTLGGHTISNLLRCLGALAPGHPSSYHRVFSRSPWCYWQLARRFTSLILARFAACGVIELAGDDTVAEHPGPRVYGKGRHRDPVRSTHSFTAFRWGHKWVVLALLVHLPLATRRWALPLRMALYRPEQENHRQGRRHKTPPELLRQLLLVLMRWFPDRKLIGTADGNYTTHELAELASRYRGRLTFLSKFYPNANLVALPPSYSGKGRPRVKGKDLPAPAQEVASTVRRQHWDVAWYGGGGNAGWKSSPGRGTGTKAADRWSQCNGSSSAT